MKLSILATITDPIKRQDRFEEAINCYTEIADEVVIVDGSNPQFLQSDSSRNLKVVYMMWPEEWNWVELPRHLNAGLKECTGDWVLKLDIDQFIHQKDVDELRRQLENAPISAGVATMQKMSFTYNDKYYQKGRNQIILRRVDGIMFGRNSYQETDLCYPIYKTGEEDILDDNGKVIYTLPVGYSLIAHDTRLRYWNYDYFFKTKEFTRKEFWRFSRAYYRYYKKWSFGGDEEGSFKKFIDMMEGRYRVSPYTADMKTHPKWIRQQIELLKPEQFGYNGWELCIKN